MGVKKNGNRQKMNTKNEMSNNLKEMLWEKNGDGERLKDEDVSEKKAAK